MGLQLIKAMGVIGMSSGRYNEKLNSYI